MKQRPALGQWLEGASNNRGRRCASFDCDAIRAAAHLGGGEDLAWSEVDPARWESGKWDMLNDRKRDTPAQGSYLFRCAPLWPTSLEKTSGDKQNLT